MGVRPAFTPSTYAKSQWATVVAETERNFGRLDILCNIAGISGRDPQMNIQTTHTAGPRLAEQTLEHWSKVMEVNSTSVFLGTKAVIAPMQRAVGGSIINISSICGIIGSHANAAYHASKGAVRIFSKAAAIQYAADKIRVNSVHPGFVDTPYRLVRRQARRDLHRLEPQHPRARDVPECDDHARWYRHARQWLWLPQAREAANLGRSRQGLATLHRDLHRGIRTARAMFESNFPIDKHSGSYAVYWNAFKRLASGASAAEKALLFRETARKFYNLP